MVTWISLTTRGRRLGPPARWSTAGLVAGATVAADQGQGQQPEGAGRLQARAARCRRPRRSDTPRAMSTGGGQLAHLVGEDLVEALPGGEAGERGRVVGQGEGGQGPLAHDDRVDELDGDVLGVGGATAVAEDEELAAAGGTGPPSRGRPGRSARRSPPEPARGRPGGRIPRRGRHRADLRRASSPMRRGLVGRLVGFGRPRRGTGPGRGGRGTARWPGASRPGPPTAACERLVAGRA